jgi:hypothetical protein
MNNATVLVACGFFLLTTFNGTVIAADQQFTCKGKMISPR